MKSQFSISKPPTQQLDNKGATKMGKKFQTSKKKKKKSEEEPLMSPFELPKILTPPEPIAKLPEAGLDRIRATNNIDHLNLEQTIKGGIQQVLKNGISETSVSFAGEDPYSPFNGTEIIIKQFDTSPKSLQIQLYAEPHAINDLQKNLPLLTEQITSLLPEWSVEFKSPKLKIHQQSPSTLVTKLKERAKKNTPIEEKVN